jgi:hypothetical protein
MEPERGVRAGGGNENLASRSQLMLRGHRQAGIHHCFGRFFPEESAETLRWNPPSGAEIMSAYVWQDGRLLGFDAVEWMTWLAAVTGIALLTLAI